MESVAAGESKLSPSASGKKFKQTRLPFQVLSGSPTPAAIAPAAAAASPTSLRTPSESRKRKPSTEAPRAAKINRTSEAKENVKHVVADAVILLDDDSIPGGVDDEGSNSRDLVDVRKDGKLVKVSTPNRERGGSESGEGTSDQKIRIKLPMASKKRKSGGAGVKDGSEKKKKAVKDKKKGKKGGAKEGKEKVPETADTEPIAIDDSDLSEDEKDEPTPDGKTEETVEPSTVDKTDEEKSKKEEEVVEEVSKVEENAKNDEPVTEDKEAEVEEPAEKPSETAKSEVTPRRGRGRLSRAAKEESEKKKSPKPRRSSAKATKQPEPSEKVKETVEEVTVEDNSEAKPSKEVEKPEEDKKEQKKVEEDTKEQAKTPEVEAKPEQTIKEAKTPSVTDNSSKRTRYSRAASAKKSEEETPKKESTPEDKKPSSAKGALDKFFAKVQQNDSSVDKPKIVVTEDPEPMEAESAENPSESRNNNNNSTIVSICLDDSDDGENTADAEENAYMLCTPNSKDRTAASGAVDNRKLTPKQMARRMEAEKRLAMKQQELDDRKRKKMEEKEAKQKEKEEKEEQKRKEREEKEEAKRKEREEKEEQKRKEKEEKDEQKRKEREEKEKKRQAELDAKNEEKRKKDEQKEEERRKKEEEKEAEEKRKQKTAQAFQSFFVKKAGSGGSKHSDDENSMESSGEDHQLQQPQQQAFMPFCVKGDMRLAPTCRVSLPKERKLRLEDLLRKSSDDQGDQASVVEDRDELYLGQLKSARYQAGTMDRTWIAEEEDGAADDDVMIIDDDVCHQIEEAAPSRRYRAKYFLFEENRRPPYRGTWRKKSANIRPRKPFAQDTKFFDYDVDSDDEWEEEEPGESLHGSDDEKDVDKEEEDYEVDNDFFVPHGHLSDEELQAEDDVADDNSPEAQKAKLKIMQQEFAAEMKKKTEKIKPRLIGCLWENGSGNERSECSAVIWEILKARAMLFDPEEPISFTTVRNEPDSNSCSPSKPGEASAQSERVPKAKMVKLVDEGVRELITMIHGCAQNRSFLVKEFLAYWGQRRDDGEKVPQFAPDSIRTKILEVSSWRPCPDEGPMQNKMCWYVNKEALVRYELTDLKVPTGWNFILKPIVKSRKERKDKDKDKEKEGGGGGEGDEGGEEKKTPPKKKKSKEVNGEDAEKKDRQSSTPSSSSKAKPAAAITKFTKKLSEDEKRKQFAKERKKSIPNGGDHKTTSAPEPEPKASSAKKTPTTATATASASTEQPKKRVQLLMSVPRGQSIPQATKNNLISQFLAKKPAAPEDAASSSNKSTTEKNGPERMDVDDEVVVLDD